MSVFNFRNKDCKTLHKKTNSCAYSCKEKERLMNSELFLASKRIFQKEISRPKRFITTCAIETSINPIFDIQKARKTYLSKTPSKPLQSTSPIKLQKRIFFSQKASQDSLIFYNQKTRICPDDTIPDWLLDRPDFHKFSKALPEKMLSILAIIAESAGMRTFEAKKTLRNWISAIDYFKKIPENVLDEVCSKLYRMDFKKDEVLIRKGDIGDCLYVIYSGKVNVYTDSHKVQCVLSEKAVVGELALDSAKPRNATIIAADPVIAFGLNRESYDAILLTIKKQEKIQSSAFLGKISFFQDWSYLKIQNLAHYLLTQTFEPGETIYDIGKNSDTFYILLNGAVEILAFANLIRNNCWPTGVKQWRIREINRKCTITIAKLLPGDYFGQFSISEQKQRNTKAICIGKTVCLTLNKSDFFEVFTKNDQEEIQLHAKVVIPSEEELEKRLWSEINEKNIYVKFT